MWKRCLLLFSFLLCSQLAADQKNSLWQQMTQKDLEFITKTLKAHYPPFYLPSHVEFQKDFEEKNKLAIEQVNTVNNLDEYFFFLEKFLAQFQDPLVGLDSELVHKRISWPGFLLSYVKGEFIVSSLSNNKQLFSSLPPYGAKLIKIDDLSPEEYLKQKVLPYFPYLPSTSTLHLLAPYLLLSNTNPSFHKSTQCTFLFEEREFTLKLAHVLENNSTIEAHLTKVSFEKNRDIFLKRLSENAFWISLPHFKPESQAEENALKKVLQKLMSTEVTDLLVFDLRSNSQLDLEWPVTLFTSLYPLKERFLTPHLFNSSGFIHYRLPNDLSSLDKDFSKKLYRIYDPVSKQKQFYSLMTDETLKASGFAAFKSPLDELKPRVLTLPLSSSQKQLTLFVVINEHTSGSSLLFIDWLSSMTKVHLVGTPSQSSLSYTNPMDFKLPSGLATFKCPIALIYPFERDIHFHYEPDYYFHPLIDKEQAIEQFIQQLHKQIKEEELEDEEEREEGKIGEL